MDNEQFIQEVDKKLQELFTMISDPEVDKKLRLEALKLILDRL